MVFHPSSSMSGFLKMWEIVENMSSKKYDANIGTTRQAQAIQHALLLSFRVFTALVINFK
jgi:hypothetical protein